jgi:hypothetical protein
MQRVVQVAAILLIAAGGAALGRMTLPRAGLRGHYFTNLTRSGRPVAVTIDRSLSTDTLDNGTAGVWSAYSVEWTGYLMVETSGAYEFATISDDGSELEVADQIVVRNVGLHGPQEAVGRIQLAAGVHPIRLRYEQAGGGFALSVRYGLEGLPRSDIPPDVLLPDHMSSAAFRARHSAPLAGAVIAVLLWITASPRLRVLPALPSFTDRQAVHITIVVTVAVAMRIFMMLGSDAILWGDSEVFIETFGNIRSGRFFQHDPFRTLLYPYFLTAFLIWSGEPPMDQIFIGGQHVLGVMSAVAFYLAGRAAFGPRVALAGALLFAIHTTQLFYENSVLSEAFFVCMLALSLLVLIAFVRSPTAWRALAAGLACVALTMTRPIAEWFVVIPIALGAWAAPAWRTRLKVATVIVLVYAAILLPWAALNQREFGFFGVALGRGLGLFIRTFEIDRLDPPERTAYPEVARVLADGRRTRFSPATYVRDELGRRYSAAQSDELMSRASIEAIREHPFVFARNTFRQWWRQLGSMQDEAICHTAEGAYLCSPRTLGYAREPFLNRPRRAREPVRPWVVWYFQHFRLPMAVVSALAMFGALAYAASPRLRAAPGLLIIVTAAYFTLLPAMAQSPQDRYRLPADGLLFLLACFGLLTLFRRDQ